MTPEHTFEVRIAHVGVCAKPNTFSATSVRLMRGQRFSGRAHDPYWVERSAGGYVPVSAVRDLGLCDMERRQEILQREIEAINIRLDELAEAVKALERTEIAGSHGS